MSNPNITWYTRQNSDAYQADSEFYAGTYTKEKALAVDMQIWNNRWGVNDVDDIENAVVVFYFETIEDSSLLKNCVITLGGNDQLTTTVKNNRGFVVLNRNIDGKKNNGDDANVDNTNNFVNITFSFSAANYILKENDIKNLYFEVISST